MSPRMANLAQCHHPSLLLRWTSFISWAWKLLENGKIHSLMLLRHCCLQHSTTDLHVMHIFKAYHRSSSAIGLVKGSRVRALPK